MPVRDEARTVKSAIRSILRQTTRDLALVVVDDGSTDSTPEILAALAERDRRLRIVSTAGDGIPGALNRGLARCDAEFVARMDGDDLAHPGRIERQVAILGESPRLWAIGSQVRAFPRREVRLGMLRYVAWVNELVTPELVERDLMVESPLVHPATMLRREALELLGGWREGLFPEDYDLWLRISAAGGSLANVPERLHLWRESEDRATRTDPRYAISSHIALKCAHLRRCILERRDRVVLWGAGATGKSFADALNREKIEVVHFLDVDVRKIGRTVRGLPVLSYTEAHRTCALGLPILVAVGTPGARPLIREELAKQGLNELSDYWCVS